MHVVATAGHVDHGKSTLIQAMTGQQPDRLRAEHERGLSIELGYCWTRLPRSGDVAFVDVPGHERFVSTMLAGVGPVPCVLFVVAADDPWMPQAAEHLAAIDALGIRHGLLVVTRGDLADPSEAMQAARSAMSTTGLAGIPGLVVSARTSAGLPELRAALDDLLSSIPAPDPTNDVRLWVDRVFSLPGIGTVVTGTLPAGEIRPGDVLRSHDHDLRVRGVESLDESVEVARGPARVALRLGASAPRELRRGAALVTPGGWVDSAEIDVRIDGLDLPREPMLHVGSASTHVRLRPLVTTDDATAARLTLPTPLPWHVGDRVLLRDPGRRIVWGADVLDPRPPRLTRRGQGRRRGRTLLVEGTSVGTTIAQKRFVRPEQLRALGHDTGSLPASAVRVGGWIADRAGMESAKGALAELVAYHRSAAPLAAGVPTAEAVRTLELPDDDVLGFLVEGPLQLRDGRVSVRSDDLPGWLDDALQALAPRFERSPFDAPGAEELTALGLDRRAVAAAARAGRITRLSDRIVVGPDAEGIALDRLAELPQPFTTSEARQALGTSRRVALALLDQLDRAGRTVRHPDDRRSVRPAAD